MPVFCESCYTTVCDFCRFYAFNGDKNGSYTGDGRCLLHDKPMEPGDGCDDFHCNHAPLGETK